MLSQVSLKIGDIAKNVPTPRLQGSVNVMKALEEMDLCETNIVAVECEDDFVGIFRRSDFNKRVIRRNLNPRAVTLYEVMTIDPPSVEAWESVKKVYEKMILNKWEYISVLSMRSLYGIVSTRSLAEDVIRAYESLQSENRMILNYIQNGESYGLSQY